MPKLSLNFDKISERKILLWDRILTGEEGRGRKKNGF